MITLFSDGPGFGLPEMNPHGAKTEIHLKMAGLPYRKQPVRTQGGTGPDGGAGGCGLGGAAAAAMPCIEDDGELVSDSTLIRDHLERKYGIDLDRDLDELERARAWAVERMIENHFGWIATHAWTMIPANFEKGPARWIEAAPAEMRPRLRGELLGEISRSLRAAGLGHLSDEEVVELGTRSLKALSLLLGDKPYFMGERPCGVDAIAFGMLAGLLTPYLDSPLRERARGFPNLTHYVARMMRQYYPAHLWGADRHFWRG